jgi:hypothetical protein
MDQGERQALTQVELKALYRAQLHALSQVDNIGEGGGDWIGGEGGGGGERMSVGERILMMRSEFASYRHASPRQVHNAYLLLGIYEGSMQALCRLYEGSMQALLRLYCLSASLRLYCLSMKALLPICFGSGNDFLGLTKEEFRCPLQTLTRVCVCVCVCVCLLYI